MPDEREIVSVATQAELWSWLEANHTSHPGVLVRLPKAGSDVPSVGFHDLLEAQGRMTPTGRRARGR